MLPLVHTVAIAVHVLFGAAWFGLGLALPSLARGAMSPGAAEGGKVVGAMSGSVVLFYAAAVLNWTLGMQLGFEAQYNTWPYHTALTLGLVLVAVQFALIRPGWARLVNGAGTPVGESGRKRIALGLGVGHAVWMIVFVLMYIGRGVVGA
ncbi:hypothetical protein [Rubrivirga sp.]|uniref:hypothetical protein n=1 Tax=Rubrivirga sp. TaxID=1885344 RepID=UPI003B526DD3